MIIIDILLAVLILAAIALCIYLVISLKKLNESLKIMQEDVHDLYENTVPLLKNLTEISERATKVTSEAEHYWQDISSSVEKVKDKISGFGKSSGATSPQNPIEDFIQNLRAITRGITAFWTNFRN